MGGTKPWWKRNHKLFLTRARQTEIEYQHESAKSGSGQSLVRSLILATILPYIET